MKIKYKKYFQKITFAVWLLDDKIIGWKIKVGEINRFTCNSAYSMKMQYAEFKKISFYIPKCMNIFIFRNGNIWYRQWKHHEIYKGSKAY